MKFIFKVSTVILCFTVFFCMFSIDAGAYSVSAKAYVLINADTLEVLAGENINKRLSMASTTKIMTAVLLAELDTPEKEIVTTAEMVTVEGSSMGLLPGDRVSYYELLVGMLLPSGNDAANTTAIAVSGSIEKFADLMNVKAKKIGMKNTHFVTPSGLDDEEHYSTAYDMALLTSYALNIPIIREIVSKPSITVTFGNPPYQRTLYNHNKLLHDYEYCIGVKTGYTKKSGRCLVSAAENNGCRVIAVTLNAPSDWNDHKFLLDYGLNSLKSNDVTYTLPLNSIPVVGGTEDTVTVSSERYLCGCTDNSADKITAKYEILPFLYAPVTLGQNVGRINYYYDNVCIHTSDIITVASVEQAVFKLGFKERFIYTLKYIFMSYI